MQTHGGISLEGLHWFQEPALHHKDRAYWLMAITLAIRALHAQAVVSKVITRRWELWKMWTQVSSSLSGAQCSSTERAYIASPQRLSICQQKLLSHLTFSTSAGASIEQLLCSFYRSREFYCLVDPASTNTALSPWKRAGNLLRILIWDVRPLSWDTCFTVQLWDVG